MSAHIISGKHPEKGLLFVAVVPEAHHVEGRVGTGKLAALLAPYRSEAVAVAALEAAGAEVPEGGRP
jgi:hypothetical protein